MAKQQPRAPVVAYAKIKPATFSFWGSPVIEQADGTFVCPGYTGETFFHKISPWNTCYISLPLANPYTPGICEVAVNKPRAVDKKKPSGDDGARITVHGVNAADVEISILIWTPEQLRHLDRLWPILFPRAAKGSPPAFDVQHPLLKRHDIKALQFIDGAGPSPGPSPGVRVFSMKALEFLKPQNVKATQTDEGAKGAFNPPNEAPTPKPGEQTKNTRPKRSA